MKSFSIMKLGTTLIAIIVFTMPAQAKDAYQHFIDKPNADTAFKYMHQVAVHPRCANCHGVVDKDGSFYPTVGEQRRPHPMAITAANNVVLFKDGERFKQVPGVPLSCASCHQQTNGGMKGMPPGNITPAMPGFVWHMPQQNMTIPEGFTAKQLCNKWLDPAHNSSHLAQRGGRDDLVTFKKEFYEHHTKLDPLVAWSWSPGNGREKAPGQRQDFIRAVGVWIDAGAPCPQYNNYDSPE
jgi:mono/diheme cytochrome c family protein